MLGRGAMDVYVSKDSTGQGGTDKMRQGFLDGGLAAALLALFCLLGATTYGEVRRMGDAHSPPVGGKHTENSAGNRKRLQPVLKSQPFKTPDVKPDPRSSPVRRNLSAPA
ncbi:hypothetical protein FJ958_22795 [Mesorhizobium sp. B2-3-5]|nr:hypothetical protein FJ958_22795 [Mesorhizobium sp. B2-3-5]